MLLECLVASGGLLVERSKINRGSGILRVAYQLLMSCSHGFLSVIADDRVPFNLLFFCLQVSPPVRALCPVESYGTLPGQLT